MSGPAALILKPGRDKSVRHGHPWLFSGAIERVDGTPASGATVGVFGSDGTFLAWAAYSPSSQIRARVWSRDENARIDRDFFASAITQAVDARRALFDGDHTAARLVHGESDGLPGVVVDRYGDTIVLQLSAAGADAWRDDIADALARIEGARCVVERSDAEVRTLEGLPLRNGVLRGSAPSAVDIVEDGLRYRVDVLHGQKTGFYLDQRDNRAIVRRFAAQRRVLNAFCYTGGFTLAALAGEAASVLSIDTASDALDLARENLRRNPLLPSDRAQWREADVFTELRRLRNANAQFDLIVLDPPKFAPTAAHVSRAARAYKDINLLALKLLAPGGLLATFSCSGGVSVDLFQKIVAGAAIDAQAQAVILQRLTASADHPIALAFPEGEYLKGLLIRKAR
ncbi:MAG TPA: class I SAM-dependent rRNA methyltransferase [Casimicrobiaceae bacterium]|nr:class I SAM-dependent rRNA methyltransferase [Casimicrobiaceae bacterium]